MAGKSQNVLRAQARKYGITYSRYNTAELKAMIAKAKADARSFSIPVRSSGDWDTFASEVEKQGPPKKLGCPVWTVLDQIPDDGKRAVQAALDREEFSHAAISRALSARGFEVSTRVLADHRRGVCKCRNLKTSGRASKTRS